MVAETGHFALVLALALALGQTVLPLWGYYRRDEALMRVALPAAQAQFLLLLVSFIALTISYVTSDFSVQVDVDVDVDVTIDLNLGIDFFSIF